MLISLCQFYVLWQEMRKIMDTGHENFHWENGKKVILSWIKVLAISWLRLYLYFLSPQTALIYR